MLKSLVTGLVAMLALCDAASAQPVLSESSVLIVTAHPDDEALFAGTVYRMTKELGARADLAVVTDGAGGYRYSVLAEPLYGLELTDPAVAREYLPGIRKRELMEGGRYIGLRNYYFFDQPDTGYTQNPDSILSDVWDAEAVEHWLAKILAKNGYDFIFVHLPRQDTHGHHKSATILALRAARRVEPRPVVLGAWISSKGNSEPLVFHGLDGYPVTEVTSPGALFHFDRTRTFGHDDRLNYKIVANWLIAEHKTQGTMQLFMNSGDVEDYWVFRENPDEAFEKSNALFSEINSKAGDEYSPR